MEMNLPVLQQLQGCRSILIAGIGGGYDVFCGLPLYFDLRDRGFNVHLANYSFSSIQTYEHGTRLSPNLVGVRADHVDIYPYFPEYFLAQWLARTAGLDVPIWSFQKVGALPLTEDYARLADHLAVDSVILVDGGVDSLMRGDEAETGTLIEDSISMAAIRKLPNLRTCILSCVGLGAERDMTYAHVFENIADLTRQNAFLGSCSLTRQMKSCALYEDAVNYVQSQRFHDPSVINSSIVSAIGGHYGDFHLTAKTRGSQLWISPLMPIMWFFDFASVARRNLILDLVEYTETFRQAAMKAALQNVTRRPAARVPL
jgi:hypothetical protein